MNVLVIGGAGFIGRHVVRALSAAGAQVVVLDRHADARDSALGVVSVRAEFGNRGDLDQLFERHRPDRVVHLASSTVPGSSNRDPEFDVVTNVCDTLHLLDLCVRHGVDKLLFLSSGGAVYGIPRHLPVDEDHPTDPISSYGITKLAVEKYLHLYGHLHGLKSVVLRAANPYGPGQRADAEQGVIGVFAHRLRQGEEIAVWGDGSVVRDYFHVHDLAALCKTALLGDAVGVFNAGSGRGLSLVEVIAALERVLGVSARVRYLPGRALDVPRIVLDTRRAQAVFGWQAHIGFEEGLAGLCSDGA
jgi:UDP-glucose 4-epimerase